MLATNREKKGSRIVRAIESIQDSLFYKLIAFFAISTLIFPYIFHSLDSLLILAPLLASCYLWHFKYRARIQYRSPLQYVVVNYIFPGYVGMAGFLSRVGWLDDTAKVLAVDVIFLYVLIGLFLGWKKSSTAKDRDLFNSVLVPSLLKAGFAGMISLCLSKLVLLMV